MSPNEPREPRLLCVSIHDVAPATWDDCQRLAHALRQVADIDLTWLVVPRYHGRDEPDAAMRAGLDAMLARGDELALHGYQHLDDQPLGNDSLRGRFLRTVYTTREGEFAALPLTEARRRIRLGLAWFAERGWPVTGFVPPAWLLGAAAWQALREFPFTYTTTFGRFHLLPGTDSFHSPSLVYAARNRAGRVISPLAAGALAALLARAPLVRLSLHPPDVRHPRLVSHAQRLVEGLLASRAAVTKAACAEALTSRDPRIRRASGHSPSPHGS